MLRKILKMFKESDLLKVHLGIIVLGAVIYVVWDKRIVYAVIIPTLLLVCTIVGRLLLDKKYERIKREWAEGAVDGHNRYARLEEEAAKMYPQYVYLHKIMKDRMITMGVNPEEHLHPTWLVTFSVWLYALAKQYENFEMTDIQIAAAIMSALTSPADSDEHIMIIFECVKDMIKAPKKYELRYKDDVVVLNDSGIIMPTSDPDEYIKLKGEEKFKKWLRCAICNSEGHDEEVTVCGVFYDIYYLTKN